MSNQKTYGQLSHGLTLPQYEKEIAAILERYIVLKWRTKKSAMLVKRLYNQGYSISDCVSMVILNSN